MDYADLRFELENKELRKEDIECPFEFLNEWISDASKCNLLHTNAMTLATVSKEGKPSSRIVLLKKIVEQKLIFFTNYESQKGRDILTNPFVSLSFFWPELSRQVRVEGKAALVDRSTSEDYFHTRPIESQIAATISKQSEKVSSRQQLESEYQNYKIKNSKVECPHFWGGFQVEVTSFEFWSGRKNRLHDRVSLVRNTNSWNKSRKYP